jgi:hypothetical protein
VGGATKMFSGMFFFLGFMMLLAGFVYMNLAMRSAQLSGEPVGWQPYALIAAAVLPFWGLAVVSYLRGKADERNYAEGENRRRILRIVEPNGVAFIGQVALATNLTREGLTEELKALVQEGRFRGFVDWDGGKMHLKKPSEMAQGNCPNCKSRVNYDHPIPVTCSSCGAEIYR